MYVDIKFRSWLPRWYLQVANLTYIVLTIRFNTWLQLPNIVTRLGWLTVYKFIRHTKLIDEQWTPILGPLIQHKDKVVMCSPFYQELRPSIACNFDSQSRRYRALNRMHLPRLLMITMNWKYFTSSHLFSIIFDISTLVGLNVYSWLWLLKASFFST